MFEHSRQKAHCIQRPWGTKDLVAIAQKAENVSAKIQSHMGSQAGKL